MKRIYESPDLKIIRFDLRDVILTSPITETTLPSEYGNYEDASEFELGDD